MLTRRYRVTGRVQGVFFRASTRDVAVRLGVSGHAVNLADGSVEVVATGSAGAQEQLADWLLEGPPSAVVDAVTWEELEQPAPGGFRCG